MGQTELDLQFETLELPDRIASVMQELYEKGYRYVAQDEGMETVCCFSLEPRKYRDGGFWGYDNPDAPGVLPAYPVQGVQLPGVRWGNRSATLIEIYLEVEQ